MNTRKFPFTILTLFIACACTMQAQTEWMQVSIPTNDGQVDLHPQDSLRCFLLTEDTGYFTTDGGVQWQPILQIRTGNRFLHINADGAGILLSAGVLYRTANHGGGWDSVTVDIDPLLTGGQSAVDAIAALGADRFFFLLGGSLYESDASASALHQLTVPLLDLQSLTVASSATWALTNAEAVAITTDDGATWHTRSTAGPADVLALAPSGTAMLGFNRTPEQVDPLLTFDGGATWHGIEWLDEAEQAVWPRIPETGAPSEPFLDIAACRGADGASILYSYPLDDTEYAVLYDVGPAGTPMHWCGLIQRIDAIYPVSGNTAWALRNRADESQTLSTVWRVHDMRKDLPTLRARDVSTDLRPAAHVAVSEGRAASWTAAHIARSSSVSSWTLWIFIDSLIYPQRSLIDTTISVGGTYRYRADFLLADGSRSTAYSDTVSLQSRTVIDMRDFLLPPAHTDLHYVDSVFAGIDDQFVGLRALTYEYIESRENPPFEVEHAYRKILQTLTGGTDTSYAAIVELASDPPAILVRDTTADGWQPLARRDSSTGWYYQKTIRLADGCDWLNERFVPMDVARVDDEQQLRLVMEEHYPAANYHGSQVYGRRGVGIVYGRSNWHILHGRGSSTLTLQSVTDVESITDDANFRIVSTWPQPAGAVMQIAVELDAPRLMRLTLHDMLGREMAQLAEGWYDAGRRVFRFDVGALPPGLYLLRAVSGEHLRVRKLLLR